MKKIPTLFERIFENRKIVGITEKIMPGCEEAFLYGEATVKLDGSCCAVVDGVFYKRYDAKKGKRPPAGAIPCCDPDPETGHWPHWVRVDGNDPGDKWFVEAFNNYVEISGYDPTSEYCVFLTFEAIGPHFQGNPYNLSRDMLMLHGELPITIERNFESVKKYLETFCGRGNRVLA